MVSPGCSLEGDSDVKPITAYTGDSVLLPCSCTDLHTTPGTFTWRKYTNEYKWIKISPESDQYKDRFQLVNDHSSGNLSLLISHLTVEDGGDYRCNVKKQGYRDFRLTVEEVTRRPLISTSQNNTTSTAVSLPFVPFALVTVIFLHIIIAVVYYRTRKKGPDRAHYSRTDGDGTVSLQ
ncbi:uncharacterized protein Hap1MRO34_018555 isoform 3-T4 [Clarias gariepinus]